MMNHLNMVKGTMKYSGRNQICMNSWGIAR